MQLDLFPTSISLRCIDPDLSKRRFYSMDVQPNLFGEWELVRQWGRIGTYGRIRRDVFASPGSAIEAMRALSVQKVRRGYIEATRPISKTSA